MRSFFRQPGHAQAITDALALRAISRIVAPGTGTEAANGKSRIERESRLNRGACLIQPAEPCQGGSKASMCVTKVSIGFDGSAQPKISSITARTRCTLRRIPSIPRSGRITSPASKILKENRTVRNGPLPAGMAANALRMRCSNPFRLTLP